MRELNTFNIIYEIVIWVKYLQIPWLSITLFYATRIW